MLYPLSTKDTHDVAGCLFERTWAAAGGGPAAAQAAVTGLPAARPGPIPRVVAGPGERVAGRVPGSAAHRRPQAAAGAAAAAMAVVVTGRARMPGVVEVVAASHRTDLAERPAPGARLEGRG